MFYGLSSCESLVWVHMKKFFHKINLSVVHNGSITGINGFRVLDIWELKTLISCVSVEFLSKKVRKLS
jgi:hypothetical protein